MGCLEGCGRLANFSVSSCFLQIHETTFAILLFNFVRILIILANFNAAKSKEEAMTDYITKVKQLLEEAAAASTS
jgi:hypothetical protein